MPAQIFIPLKKQDVVDEIIPYLNVLARPGSQVVFLAAYKEEVSWMEVQMTAMQTGITSMAGLKTLAANASRQAQLRSLEKRIDATRKALTNAGLTVTVEAYTGSVRNAVASLRDTETEMIVILTCPYKIIGRLIARVEKLLNRFRNADSTPLLVLRPHRQH